jgi:DNA primase
VGRIPDRVVDEVRERVDIVDLISRYLALKPAGRNHKGLCPFHSEKTPSFNVSRERQIFHCFGCGVGGNVFGFLMRHDNLAFPEAVRVLARECGVEIAEEEGSARDQAAQLVKANDLAQRLYRRSLESSEGAAARAYLAGRGLDPASIDRFGVGFAPDRWDAVARALSAEGLAPEIGERAGLLSARSSGGGYYDRLRGRITFPIHDVRGRVLGFGGRATKPEQEPKYLNTPETALFHKREALYGLPLALEASRRADRLVVVEGYFDLIALHRAGIAEGVATCGTALTPDHGKALRRRVREVVLLFDGDRAGERALTSALEVLLPHGLRVRAVSLPSGDDPDTFLAREGEAALRALVEGAPAASELAIARAVSRGVSTPWQKADAVSQVAPLLALIKDPVERAELIRRLALAVEIEARHVELSVRAAARGEGVDSVPRVAPSLRRDVPEERAARTVARLLLGQPVLAGRVSESELAMSLPEGAWRELVLALHRSAAAGQDAPASKLADQLAGETRDLLLALAVAEDPGLEAKAAERAFDETLIHLGRRRLAREAKALTQRLRLSPQIDADLLAAKQRQLEQKKLALGVRPGTGTGR